MTSLLPMDIACLEYLVAHGDNGSMPTIAIPSRMFQGEIPIEFPNLVELGLIEHTGDRTTITLLGRMAIPPAERGTPIGGHETTVFDAEVMAATERRTPGLWASLTPEQQAAALAYRGDENHGDSTASSLAGSALSQRLPE